jgi:hypothetical protein
MTKEIAVSPVPSTAFQCGFDDGFQGRKYRNPCSGNAKATDQYALGFAAGEKLGATENRDR